MGVVTNFIKSGGWGAKSAHLLRFDTGYSHVDKEIKLRWVGPVAEALLLGSVPYCR